MQVGNLQIAAPYFSVLLFVVAYYLWKSFLKGEKSLWFSSTPVTGSSWRVSLRKWLPVLPAISFLLWIIALCRPQLCNQQQIIEGKGIDIIICMDVSGSMLAKDFEPNRLEVAKKTAESFAIQRIADRIGLVIFSGEAFTLCPPTLDKNVISAQILNIKGGGLKLGTSIGNGLAVSVDKLSKSTAKSKVIIFLTDGVNNIVPNESGETASVVDPETALQIAKTFGIKVYTIGVGSLGKALTPVGMDEYGDWIYNYEPVEIDEPLLKKIATETKGKYFRAKDDNTLINIYKEIDKLEKSTIKTRSYTKIKELFPIFIKLGLVIFLIYLFLRFTILRSVLDY